MTVSRNYLLMILDEEKGKRYSKTEIAKDLGLAGAFLMDLYLQGKISIQKKRVKVIDSSKTGDEYLDEIFNIIKTSKKNAECTTMD